MASELKARIDRLYQYSLDHRAEVGRFGSIVAQFTQELETRIPRVELEGVLEWHELIGSTPPPSMLAACEAVRSESVASITQLILDTESRWGLT